MIMPQLDFSTKTESYSRVRSIPESYGDSVVTSRTFVNPDIKEQSRQDHTYTSSALSRTLELVPIENIQISKNSATASASQSPEIDPHSVIQYRDPWLNVCLDNIDAHKNLPEGWDGETAPAPEQASLTTAEFLAFGFSYLPLHLRPQFSVDAEGVPGFSLYNDQTYLHLTIDDPELISWYAVQNGEETFGDEVVVNGINFVTVAASILK